MWTAWKGTSCIDWDGGWFGKVPRVWFGLWSVPSVRNGIVDGLVFEQGMVGMVPSVRIEIVDCLERYIMYSLEWWLDWKGAQSADWVCG
jgi:hypothetical protein